MCANHLETPLQMQKKLSILSTVAFFSSFNYAAADQPAFVDSAEHQSSQQTTVAKRAPFPKDIYLQVLQYLPVTDFRHMQLAFNSMGIQWYTKDGQPNWPLIISALNSDCYAKFLSRNRMPADVVEKFPLFILTHQGAQGLSLSEQNATGKMTNVHLAFEDIAKRITECSEYYSQYIQNPQSDLTQPKDPNAIVVLNQDFFTFVYHTMWGAYLQHNPKISANNPAALFRAQTNSLTSMDVLALSNQNAAIAVVKPISEPRLRLPYSYQVPEILVWDATTQQLSKLSFQNYILKLHQESTTQSAQLMTSEKSARANLMAEYYAAHAQLDIERREHRELSEEAQNEREFREIIARRERERREEEADANQAQRQTLRPSYYVQTYNQVFGRR